MSVFYKTIEKEGNSNHRVLASKHLGFALPIKNEFQAKELIKEFKARYYDANHVCFAYRCGIADLQRNSDDGEPTGTAGKPIAGAILSNGITQTLVMVVRYFGGTKLGTGGLIQAYKTAALMAIEDAGIIEKRWKRKVEISCDYDQLPLIMSSLKQMDAEKEFIIQEERCLLAYIIDDDLIAGLIELADNSNKINIQVGELL